LPDDGGDSGAGGKRLPEQHAHLGGQDEGRLHEHRRDRRSDVAPRMRGHRAPGHAEGSRCQGRAEPLEEPRRAECGDPEGARRAACRREEGKMNSTNRRDFLRASAAAALSAAVPADLFAQSETKQSSPGAIWDSGSIRHLLPTVSDSRMLIKVSFTAPLEGEPRLRVGDLTVRGSMGDTRGEHWHFYAT